jgi:hypothetical protein
VPVDITNKKLWNAEIPFEIFEMRWCRSKFFSTDNDTMFRGIICFHFTNRDTFRLGNMLAYLIVLCNFYIEFHIYLSRRMLLGVCKITIIYRNCFVITLQNYSSFLDTQDIMNSFLEIFSLYNYPQPVCSYLHSATLSGTQADQKWYIICTRWENCTYACPCAVIVRINTNLRVLGLICTAWRLRLKGHCRISVSLVSSSIKEQPCW